MPDSVEKDQLFGKYTNMTTGRSGPLTIEDLSMEGIGFRVTLAECFNVGDLVVGGEILEIVEGAADFGLYLLP